MKMNPDSSPDPRISFFDRLAPQWDHMEQSPEETLRQVEEHATRLGLESGQDVLEIGCGTGQLTGWLCERVRPGRVLCIDFSSEMIARARAKGLDAEFRVADVCQIDLGENAFDVAFCFHAFPHFSNQHAALERIARALKPGGRLIVMHLNSRQGVNAFHDQVGGEVAGDHLPSDAEWKALFAATGFKQRSLTDREGLFLLEAVWFG